MAWRPGSAFGRPELVRVPTASSDVIFGSRYKKPRSKVHELLSGRAEDPVKRELEGTILPKVESLWERSWVLNFPFRHVENRHDRPKRPKIKQRSLKDYSGTPKL